MDKLSVIIITKNEADNITHCLTSLAFADEIIILDSGSSDNTIEICQRFTDKIFSTDWPGFGPQKNRALDKASYDWVLSIDADEMVSPELAREIKTLLAAPDKNGYHIQRISRYCGRTIRYSGWQSDKPLRLFNKHFGRFTNDIVHEKIVVAGPLGNTTNPLYHTPYKNLTQVLEKINTYSTYGAEQRLAKGKKGNLPIAIGRGLWAFVKAYIIKRGFLDGREGFMLAVSNALTTFYCYMKLAYLLKNRSNL